MTIESAARHQRSAATDDNSSGTTSRSRRADVVGREREYHTTDADAEAETSTRSPISADRLRLGLGVADLCAVLFGGAIAIAGWVITRTPGDSSFESHLLLFVASLPIWMGAIVARRLLVARAVREPAEELQRIWTASAIASGLTVLLAFFLQSSDVLSRGWIALLFVSVGTALSIERWVARKIFYRLRRAGRITRRIAIIGTDTNAIRIIHTLQHDPSYGYTVAGYVGDDDIGDRGGIHRLGPLSRTADLLTEHDCNGAIISLPSIDTEAVNSLTRSLTERGIHVALSTSLNDIHITRLRPQELDHRTMLYVEPTIRDGWRARAKRAFDIAVSVVALLVASPILLIAGAAIMIESRGGVLFRQERVGRNGESFTMLKLRTMYRDAEERLEELLAAQDDADTRLFKMTDDPRVTRVGRILRKWSIDEIPQFINVIRGEMSIVGPRPALPREVEQWDDETRERLRVMPGITGLWQVEGRSDADFDAYKRLDLFYVDNWSLAHDLVIVLKTFSAVVTHRGAR